jgi:hypothetical protein
MGRQFRPPRRGPDQPAGLPGMSHMPITVPYVVSASSTVVAIPNYGATDLSAYAAGDFVLDAPAAGVVKTLFSYTSTAAARVIRGSTSTAVKFGNQGFTEIQWGNSTSANAVTLLGVNSTLWAIISGYPTTVSTADSPKIATS